VSKLIEKTPKASINPRHLIRQSRRCQNTTTRILLADDFPIVREGLKQLLQEEIQSVCFGEAANCSEALRLIEKEDWDILVLDICMPGRNGLEALKEVKSKKPDLPVLVLSMYPEDQFAERAINSGADGYINKESDPESIIVAIKKIIGGGKYLTPSCAENIVFHSNHSPNGIPHKILSDREYQIMLMLANGKPLSKIADELALSVKTVSTYRMRLLHKLGMDSNAQLIRYAISESLTM
jgi:DNA-binding NarL/FixJ family response regulator